MRSINDLSCVPAMPPTSGMIPLSAVAAAPDGSRTITASLFLINAAARQQKRPDRDGDPVRGAIDCAVESLSLRGRRIKLHKRVWSDLVKVDTRRAGIDVLLG